jgi:hypothetical protein
VAVDEIEAALAAREATATGDDPDDPAVAPGAGERAVATVGDLDAARRLLERRGAALLREVDPRRRRAKAYALLARSGFDPDVCRDAVTSWLEEPEPNADS